MKKRCPVIGNNYPTKQYARTAVLEIHINRQGARAGSWIGTSIGLSVAHRGVRVACAGDKERVRLRSCNSCDYKGSHHTRGRGSVRVGTVSQLAERVLTCNMQTSQRPMCNYRAHSGSPFEPVLGSRRAYRRMEIPYYQWNPPDNIRLYQGRTRVGMSPGTSGA